MLPCSHLRADELKENKWLGSGGGSSAMLVRSGRDQMVVSGPKTLMAALQEWDSGASGRDNDFLVSRLPEETLGRLGIRC